MGTACKEGAEQFSVGLKVLVVDDDVTCLRILEQMLRKCTYTVTTCSQATVALNILRERKENFDLVLSDVHMPDMDGFKLLEFVGLEMDLPVIMMSGDDRTSLVMRGIRHGACDYLIKPIRIEELKNIWQHVVRKRCTVSKEPEEDNGLRRHGNDESEYSCANDGADGGLRTHKKRKDTKEDDDAELENDDPGTSKKKRVVWSVELHQQFVSAVYQLGIDKAVPKRILELMNVPGLTRENVASHLQKFRLYLKRLSRVAQLNGGLPKSYCAPLDSIPQVGSTVGRFDLQALAASGQIPQKSLAALHAELLDHRTSTVVLPAMDQSSLQVSLPTSKCTTLDQNIAYGQPLGKRLSIAPNHFSQEFFSAENFQPGLGSWSSKGTTSVVNCDNLSGVATQNGGAIIDIMNHQSRELRQPHEHQQRQSALPELSRTINVQPSCLVPSYSSSNFQSGNSIGSANQSCSLGGSSNVNYNMLLPQLNNPELDTRRVQDLEIKHASQLGGLSGFGSLFPASLSSGSLNINNCIGVEVPASRSNGGRLLSGLASNASAFLDSYDATSANFLDQRMLKDTGFFGRATPVPSHIHINETGLAVNYGDRENMYGENIGNNKVKQEASMNFCENCQRGSSNVATSFS